MQRAILNFLFVCALAAVGCESAPLVDEATAARALERAKMLYQEGNFQAAMVAFQTYRSGQTDPLRVAEGYYWEGMSLLAQREFESATRKFESGLEQKPDGWIRAYILSGLGESLMGLGDFSAARGAYLKSLDSCPEEIRLDHVLLRLATCAQRLNKWEEADGYLNRLLDELPGSMLADQAREKLQYGKRRFFTVQVGAYGTDENARKRAAELRQLGMRPFVGQIQRGGEQLHCVSVGKFDSWEEANLAISRIRGQAQIENAIVKP